MHPLWVIFIIVIVILLLYMLLVKPRNQANTDWAPFQNYLYAHRGLHNEKSGIPENSLTAFKRAVEAGYGIELDVCLSRDRIPMVFHDFDLKRMCGVDKKVCELTGEELGKLNLSGTQEKIPTLSEVLELVAGQVPLIIEYKVEGMDISICPIVNSMLREYNGHYLIESFNSLVLSWYRSNRNDVIRGQLSSGSLLKNGTTRPDFIAYNHEKSHNISFKMATQFFKGKAVAWTVKSQQELDRAKEDFDIFIFEGFIPNNRSIKSLK